jgi:Tol biopolymer transport system component
MRDVKREGKELKSLLLVFTSVAGTLLLTITCSAAEVSNVQNPKKVPLTHEALWMMKRVGAPIPSPDGKYVMFTLVEPAYDPEKAVSDLWLVNSDGSLPPRRLTQTKGPEGGAVWSPDSTHIAFSAKREGDLVSQIYVLDIGNGGDARRITDSSTGAVSPQWRPDGGAILFESTVYPNTVDDEGNKRADAERKALKYHVRTYEHFPVRKWNDWLDERQPTILVQSLEPGSKPKDILSPTTLARTSGFSGVDHDQDNSLQPLWSPDGKEILFTATTERWNAAFSEVRCHMYRMPATGESEPRLLMSDQGQIDAPAFSPDGKSLFFLWTPQNGEGYNLPRLKKVAWPQGG